MHKYITVINLLSKHAQLKTAHLADFRSRCEADVRVGAIGAHTRVAQIV